MGKTRTVDLQVKRVINQSNYFTKPKEVNFQDSGLLSAKESHRIAGGPSTKVKRLSTRERAAAFPGEYLRDSMESL